MEILKYTDEHNEFRISLREFLNKEVVPYIDECEKNHFTPKSIWQKMGQAGFLCSCVLKDYGGHGQDFIYSVIIIQEMAKISFTGLISSLHSDIIVPYIETFGSEQQKKRYLPGCVTGDLISAVAMTEPDAGSDVAGMQTTAIEDNDEIIINGSKTFISNAVNCDFVVLAAKDPAVKDKHQAVSLYIVDADTPGFTKGKPFDKMGWNSQDTGELFFSNCRIPKENLIGEKGSGFIILMQKLQQERLVCALGGIYGAEAMLEKTIEYCKNTKVNDRPLSKSQSTMFSLVEMASEIKIVKAFMELLVKEHMQGEQVISETCMSKFWATDLSKRVSSQCLDLVGSYGMLEDCYLARAFRDTRVTSIFAGTNEIMKGIIGKMMQL